MDEQFGKWYLLTNHARVLVIIAREAAPLLRDIAEECGITERTVQSIVTDLEQAGYPRREREGRCTRYSLRLDSSPKHPAEAHVSVRELPELFGPRDSRR
ncbi:helix-turn-helix transcriptional regulator [Streptomyces sp. NPDC090499]|uniref:helix-turn-helix transcriptional regulator n=1 Tax=Streptomyces sp. NPDC090499 TaxID=3365965 RepID=UPI003829EB4D